MAYDYRHRIMRAMTRCAGLLAAVFALFALLGGVESWRAATHCSTATCIVASEDLPELSGDIAAIVELSDDMSSDDPVNPSDEKAYKDATVADRLLFAVAAITTAVVLDRPWRTLYPDKTGPPRA